jgi:hypothetical protein
MEVKYIFDMGKPVKLLIWQEKDQVGRFGSRQDINIKIGTSTGREIV